MRPPLVHVNHRAGRLPDLRVTPKRPGNLVYGGDQLPHEHLCGLGHRLPHRPRARRSRGDVDFSGHHPLGIISGGVAGNPRPGVAVLTDPEADMREPRGLISPIAAR